MKKNNSLETHFLHYQMGDATLPKRDGNQIIAHVCNDCGAWGKGFVLSISKRFKAPEKAYRDWYAGRATNAFGLGKIQIVQVEDHIWVANMVAQHGIKKTRVSKSSRSQGSVPIRYDAVRECLQALAQEALVRNASIHMPRIGCGLAGGTWEEIEPLILDSLCKESLSVYIYD